MDNNMFYMPRSEPWDGEGFEPAPQKYLLSRTQSDQAARGLEGPGSYKTFPPKPANRGLTPGASQPPGHLPVAPQIACPPEQGFPDCYSPPPPHNRTAAPLRPVPPPRSSRIRGPVTSFSEARGENKPGRRRKKEVKKESSGPVTPTELVELGPRGPWYSSSGDDRSPFSGVGLRWHSGLAYSSSDAGSRPPPPRPNKAFQRSSSEEHTPSNHASCLQLGGAGRRKTPPGSRVRALITGQVDHRPNRDSYSSGVDRLSDFPFGVDEYAVQQHGPYGEENPQQQHYKQQQQQYQQQQQQQQQLFHQNDYHTAHYTQQHPHVTRDVSEETFQRLPSGYPRVHDMPPASPNPSSYNFNNRVQPKRESLPKNFEDLDLSIKNEFEKIRKTYDKGRSDEDENRNRLSAKRNKTSSKRKPNNTSVRANGKNNSSNSNSNSNSNNNSNKNSSGKSRKSQALHNVFASHTANSEPRRQGSTSSRQDGTSPEKEKDLVSQKDSSRQQLRDDFDEKRRRRTRNHVIFLLVVLVVVAVAVLSAVLVATLGSSAGYMMSTTPASVTNYCKCF
ncbi:putative mediator of RNA polymerase II transcription subunit 24 [Aplysia californica]|uniref:Mediator of RNA polymerase II transcription subunit 24 n=1 Tax=Aplysia californica TaxID=6500 RepID=A0ABM1VU15_APLCA|nr:putative mediator of RNA polymerase II transcription subunit 24 [Aplysia californica]